MRISIIAALAENFVIGKDNQLPWRLPADFQRLKQITWGKPLIMGRNTFTSLGKPVPGREHIVITSDLQFEYPGVHVARSLDEALAIAATFAVDEVFIFGGATLYQAALALTTRMYLTFVKQVFPGDTYFPRWNESEWEIVSSEPHQADERNPYDYEFVILERCIRPL